VHYGRTDYCHETCNLFPHNTSFTSEAFMDPIPPNATITYSKFELFAVNLGDDIDSEVFSFLHPKGTGCPTNENLVQMGIAQLHDKDVLCPHADCGPLTVMEILNAPPQYTRQEENIIC